jgi:Zn-dependent protease
MSETVLLGLVFWFPAFLFSTTVHEAAHAWAALRLGDPTAYHGGQVSLNPWPHVRREPVGMLVLPLVTAIANGWSIGWASAPYDPHWAARWPRRAAWMAAAGPAGNLAIALVAFGLLKLGLAAGVFDTPVRANMSLLVGIADAARGGVVDFAARALSVLLVLNALLAVFNLLPLPPLDGASVAGLVLPEGLATALRSGGPVVSLVGLLVAWKVFPMLAGPILRAVLGALHPGSSWG